MFLTSSLALNFGLLVHGPAVWAFNQFCEKGQTSGEGSLCPSWLLVFCTCPYAVVLFSDLIQPRNDHPNHFPVDVDDDPKA
ncbi:MAG: hypothetical protein RMK65_12795, partial [Anaerolineae bacterium]|nr:hypothetical protein [Anaerolineae bacterium]